MPSRIVYKGTLEPECYVELSSWPWSLDKFVAWSARPFFPEGHEVHKDPRAHVVQLVKVEVERVPSGRGRIFPQGLQGIYPKTWDLQPEDL